MTSVPLILSLSAVLASVAIPPHQRPSVEWHAVNQEMNEEGTALLLMIPSTTSACAGLVMHGQRNQQTVAPRPEIATDDVVLQTPAPFLEVVGKGGKVRTIPLVPEAQEVVRHFLGGHDGDTLLPFTYREIYRGQLVKGR